MINCRYINYIAMFALALFTSACATQGLNSLLKEKSGLQSELSYDGTKSENYVRGKEFRLQGYYTGLIDVEKRRYFAITLDNIRIGCGQSHEAMILIPAESNANPIMSDNLLINYEKLGNVDIVFRDSPPPMWPPTEKLKEPLTWNGYPDKIIIYFSRDGSDLTTQYRFGQGPNDVDLSPIKDNLRWECRSKPVYYSLHLLYPFLAVYDVVTLPVQWLLWQIWH